MVELERGPGITDPDSAFTVRTRFDSPVHTVELSGELDVASRDTAVLACATTDQLNVLVDLSNLTFMDCAGYGAFVVARSVLERRGGTLVLVNPVGEPRRLLTLIDELAQGRCVPIPVTIASMSPLQRPSEAPHSDVRQQEQRDQR